MSDSLARLADDVLFPDPFADLHRLKSWIPHGQHRGDAIWEARKPLRCALVALSQRPGDAMAREAGWIAAGQELRKQGMEAFVAAMTVPPLDASPSSPKDRAVHAAWCVLHCATSGTREQVAKRIADVAMDQAVREEFGEALVDMTDACLARWNQNDLPKHAAELRTALLQCGVSTAELLDRSDVWYGSLSPSARSAMEDLLPFLKEREAPRPAPTRPEGYPVETRQAVNGSGVEEASLCFGDGRPDLTDREWNVLEAMERRDAHSMDSRMTRKAIAKEVEGPKAKPAAVGRAVARLARLEFVETKTGSQGGCWLTGNGKDAAKRRMLERKRNAEKRCAIAS